MTILPSAADLERLFALKYGDPATTGPNPRRRHAHNYYLPSDHYEAAIANAVFPGCDWLDVGGGSSPFPDNPKLAAELAARANRFVGVDPSDNVFDNPYTREKHKAFIEDYHADAPFDLATLRMVAEHVTNPAAVIGALGRLVKPGGRVVIFTVDEWSPITLVSRVVPFDLHHPVKKFLWGGEEKDTFPTAYLMNSRRELKKLFARGGFREAEFGWVDDCVALSRFPQLNTLELVTRSVLRKVGLRYPECNLLGVYRRLA